MTHESRHQQTSGDVTQIVIAGGGSAGWMTAALLNCFLPSEQYTITVVDSETGGIGVGEATIPSMVRLIRKLGANESDFVRECHATWKLAIQFQDWKQKGHCNWHPFGVCGALVDDRDLFSYWLSDTTRPYHSYSINHAASVAGKSPHRRGAPIPSGSLPAYAFHLDAHKLANWLKQRALQGGVRLIADEVVDVTLDSSGDVKSLQLKDNNSIAGNLFIDCTGFATKLMNRLGTEVQDYSQQLLCDSAIVTQTSPSSIVAPYTKTTALSSGWAWEIPLIDRRGIGYVYSSRFVNEQQATEELIQAMHLDENTNVTQKLSFQTQRRMTFWNRNVIAIGLSAGFVEPLESSGLHLVQIGIEQLISLLPATQSTVASTTARRAYNREMSQVFDQIVDFVQLHYLLSERKEEFWKAARNAPTSEGLQHRMKLFNEIGLLDELHPAAFPDTSYYYLLAGYEQLPKRAAAFAITADQERIQFVLKAMNDQNQMALRQLPLHEESLRQIHQQSATQAS